MPHSRPQDLPSGGGGRWPFAGDLFRSEQWGDLDVGFTTVTEPLDCTDSYRVGGMPGGVCPCPHYGYVLTGSLTARYPDTGAPDETATAGEVYFFPAGHVLIYPEATTAIEFNPAYALTQCMDAMARAMERYTEMYAAGQAGDAPTGG